MPGTGPAPNGQRKNPGSITEEWQSVHTGDAVRKRTISLVRRANAS